MLIDKSNHSLVAILLRKKKLIEFYLYKLKGTEKNHTVVKRGLSNFEIIITLQQNRVQGKNYMLYDNQNLLSGTDITKELAY